MYCSCRFAVGMVLCLPTLSFPIPNSCEMSDFLDMIALFCLWHGTELCANVRSTRRSLNIHPRRQHNGNASTLHELYPCAISRRCLVQRHRESYGSLPVPRLLLVIHLSASDQTLSTDSLKRRGFLSCGRTSHSICVNVRIWYSEYHFWNFLLLTIDRDIVSNTPFHPIIRNAGFRLWHGTNQFCFWFTPGLRRQRQLCIHCSFWGSSRLDWELVAIDSAEFSAGHRYSSLGLALASSTKFLRIEAHRRPRRSNRRSYDLVHHWSDFLLHFAKTSTQTKSCCRFEPPEC